MGVSSQVSFSLKDIIEANEGNKTSSYLWSKKVLAASQAKKRRPRRILMKRRGGGYRRGSNGIRRRVRILKKLIPNSGDSLGLDGLFKETANYILSLQTRVRVMQVMVKVLTGSDDE